jgi:plasmid replication initiation protein
MAEKQLLLPSPIVKMDNALARASWPDGGQHDLDLFMHVISKIRHDDDELKEYRFPISELGYGSKLDGRTYQRFKDALERLAKGILKVDGKGDSFRFYSMFITTGYEKGQLLVKLHPDLKPFFLHLQKHFTCFELFEMRMLPSEYSKRLFLLLKSYASMGQVQVMIADLHEKLITPGSFRANFKDFRRRVLDKAQKDLTHVLPFEWQPVKRGRAVVAVEFVFGKKVFELQKEKTKALEAKNSKARNKAFIAAVNCASGKQGICAEQDNKRSVCKLCVAGDLCGEQRRIASGQLKLPAPLP